MSSESETASASSNNPAGGDLPPNNITTGSGGFIHLFAQHRVAANLLMAMMIIFGAYSLTKLNKQFFSKLCA